MNQRFRLHQGQGKRENNEPMSGRETSIRVAGATALAAALALAIGPSDGEIARSAATFRDSPQPKVETVTKNTAPISVHTPITPERLGVAPASLIKELSAGEQQIVTVKAGDGYEDIIGEVDPQFAGAADEVHNQLRQEIQGQGKGPAGSLLEGQAVNVSDLSRAVQPEATNNPPGQ